MQTQHLIIIATGQLAGLVLLGYFIRRAFLRALARATADDRDRIHALSNDLGRAAERCQVLAAQVAEHQGQQLQLKAQPFTLEDQQTLISIAQALGLASSTYKAIPGTAPVQAKADALAAQARALAYRVFNTATAGGAMNADSLDTKLIEWLNTHGSFWPELENSTVTFPHEANTEGYPHIRDALREAYELHLQHEAGELVVEDAA
ncbi:hypothetical protein SAMN05216178_6293 [Pseudomonas saponiphila]|uniref:Uncharacterized protein n=1 Tax=Pseudomonas saponiphila TaxID=556534 RepID=A0A1H4Y0N7_9PSED|nr:hypothetical protein [Pseudomonas saponiphila]SED11526.1 hypothetical protein SAMN05216178_6293 [Pseudomonas saponiphila]